jgi:hypothetical protein
MQGSSLQIDWWKNWEMTIGLVGGLAFGAAFWRFNRPARDRAATSGRLERAWLRTGLHLSLPSFVLLGGAYDGWCQLRNTEVSRSGFVGPFLASVCVPLTFRLWRGRTGRPTGAGCGASLRTSLALVGMIVGAGYLVSIPTQWQLANVVLITLYTALVGASALLTTAIWRRRAP